MCIAVFLAEHRVIAQAVNPAAQASSTVGANLPGKYLSPSGTTAIPMLWDRPTFH